jgi:hypothetical protein
MEEAFISLIRRQGVADEDAEALSSQFQSGQRLGR